MMRHLIYGALSAPSHVATDRGAGGRSRLRCWNSNLKAESGRSARHRSERLFHLAIRVLFWLERMIERLLPITQTHAHAHTHRGRAGGIPGGVEGWSGLKKQTSQDCVAL